MIYGNAEFYTRILDNCLSPFIDQAYHRFMQDNDPKHTSRTAQQYFQDRDINWWRTPPESPDANPIEKLWHELKVSPYCMDNFLLFIYNYAARL